MGSDRKNRRNSADACERGCAEMENRTGRHGELDIAVSSAPSTPVTRCRLMAVRPEGADHQWRKIPPGELSIDPVADERLVRATASAEAS
jgi:hypothetical protein